MNDMVKFEVLRNAFVACGIDHKVIDIIDPSGEDKKDKIIKVIRGMQEIEFPFDAHGNYLRPEFPPLTPRQYEQGVIGQ